MIIGFMCNQLKELAEEIAMYVHKHNQYFCNDTIDNAKSAALNKRGIYEGNKKERV